MSRIAVIRIQTEELTFSAGHFVLFSENKRETLHGHDYRLSLELYTRITHNGLSFDSRHYKNILQNICRELDYRYILPAESPYLKIVTEENHYIATFGNESLPFLKKDAVVLPIINGTLEEFSAWILKELCKDPARLAADAIQGLRVFIANGRGEEGSTAWGDLRVVE